MSHRAEGLRISRHAYPPQLSCDESVVRDKGYPDRSRRIHGNKERISDGQVFLLYAQFFIRWECTKKDDHQWSRYIFRP
ncbi:hypothetical protein TNCV_82971 [Trichonephila clavipes]|nr:hypothetical protein TNCV_82971 [Trichonephila clavipes]